MANERNPSIGGGDAEREFVLARLEAFLADELPPDEKARVQAFLDDCANTKALVESERELMQAVQRCVTEEPAPCPPDLRKKVLAALDRCELLDPANHEPAGGALTASVLRFRRAGWFPVSVLTAACLLLAAGLFLFLRPANPEDPAPGLTDALTPMVASVSLAEKTGNQCRYRRATEEYRRHFQAGPSLPRMFNGLYCRVVGFQLIDVGGRRAWATHYTAPDGNRFILLIMHCDCLGRSVPESIVAAEFTIDGKVALVLRQGEYMKVLVGDPAPDSRRMLQQCMESLRADT